MMSFVAQENMPANMLVVFMFLACLGGEPDGHLVLKKMKRKGLFGFIKEKRMHTNIQQKESQIKFIFAFEQIYGR